MSKSPVGISALNEFTFLIFGNGTQSKGVDAATRIDIALFVIPPIHEQGNVNRALVKYSLTCQRLRSTCRSQHCLCNVNSVTVTVT